MPLESSKNQSQSNSLPTTGHQLDAEKFLEEVKEIRKIMTREDKGRFDYAAGTAE